MTLMRLLNARQFGMKLSASRRFIHTVSLENKELEVSFIGLGAMGAGMAKNLAHGIAGRVKTYDINQKVVDESKEYGCFPAAELEDVVAERPDVMFTSLPTTAHGKLIAKHLLETGKLKPGSIWVDVTSGVPAEAREIAEMVEAAGVSYLDAGVAGGPNGANTGTLSMMVGGKEDALSTVTPLLKLLSAPGKVTYLGPSGAGHAVKSVNNALLAANIVTAGEALTVLAKQGIPIEKALAAINTSSGRSLVTSERIPDHVLSRKFDFGFKVGFLKKDTGIAVSQFDGAKMKAPMLRQADHLFEEAMNWLGPNAEHMRILEKIEREAGAEIAATPGNTSSCDPVERPNRVFNFSAGPACLPTDVLKDIRREFVNYQDSGMSIIEMSHRDAGGPTQNCITESEALIREMANVPDNYHVLFFAGGAHGQFAGIPMNLAHENNKVDILDMGVWTKRAMTEAVKSCDVNVPYTCTTTMDDPSKWNYRKDAAYVHICMNETISGLEILEDPTMPADAPPLVADATSTFLSRPMDISKYGVVYASAGKNFGPAGVTIVIVRDDLVKRTPHPMTPGILSLQEAVKSVPIHSIYNTPPVFQIYSTMKILRWVKEKGGLQAMERQAKRRADRMYEIIDNSGGFYTNEIDPNFRSRMNICFNIKGGKGDEAVALENKFVSESEAAGMLQLFKHPAFGGLRITSYNGLEEAAIDAVCKYLVDFKERNS